VFIRGHGSLNIIKKYVLNYVEEVRITGRMGGGINILFIASHPQREKPEKILKI